MAQTASTTHKYTKSHDIKHDNSDRRVRVDTDAQRREYGGLNIGASFFGWLTATGVAVLITSLLAGAGSAIALTAAKNINPSNLVGSADTVGLVSGLLLLIALALAYYTGGYVAGRMSRFDGARQGVGVWIIGVLAALLLGAIGAIFGAKYNVLQQVNLPHIPVGQSGFTTAGIITLIVLLVVTLLTAMLGGRVGEQYHRKVDRLGVV
jgi:hypothetical protein